MAADTVIPTRRFAGRAKSGVFYGLSWAGMICAGVALVLSLLMVTGVVPASFALPVIAVLLAVGIIRPGGRALVEWVPILGGHAWRAVRRQTQFARRVGAPRASANLGLPGDAARLRIVSDQDGTVFIHDPALRHFTAVLRVKHGGTILMDRERQAELDRGWAGVMESVAKFDTEVCRLQVLERTLASGGGLHDHYQQNTTTDVPEDALLRQAYSELVAKQGEALGHESLVSITMDLKAAASRVREMGGGMIGAVALTREVMASVQGAVHSAGLSPDGWVTEPSVALMVRGVYDPQSVQRLKGAAVGRRVADAGPMGARESWTWVETDSAVHRVFAVTEWPRHEVDLMALWPMILTPGIQRSISTIYRPVALRRSRKEARTAAIQANQQLHRRSKQRGWVDPGDQSEQQDAHRRLGAITRGAREFEYVGLVTVSAESHAQLRRSCRVMLTAAARADIELRPLVGQQAQHLVTGALPFGRGL